MQSVFAFWRWPNNSEEFYFIEGIVLILLFSYFWKPYLKKLKQGVSLTAPAHFSSALVLFLLVFFSMNNYLGLRTAGNFSMFSNLVTEGETSNHILLKSNPLKFFSMQEDVVEIIDLDPRLKGSFRKSLTPSYLIPKIEFSRIVEKLKLQNMKNLYLKVFYDGKAFETHDLSHDNSFNFETPWWQKKLFKFRHIHPTGPQTCHW